MALRQDEWPRSGVTICRRDVGLARFELATLDPQIERATIDPQIDGCAREPVGVDRELPGVGDERVRAQVLVSLGPNRAQVCVSLRRSNPEAYELLGRLLIGVWRGPSWCSCASGHAGGTQLTAPCHPGP